MVNIFQKQQRIL